MIRPGGVPTATNTQSARVQTERITSTRDAASILRAGGLVAFPTETVFGLGADATNPAAIEKLFAAKGRPSDNPLIVHLGEVMDWEQAASTLTPSAEALLAAFAPGPLTVVLPKQPSIAPPVTAGLETVGLRVPGHPVARAILRQAGTPIAAPSANESGRPSCTKWESVLEDLDGRIDAVFCEDSDGLGIESTVVDCSAPVPTLLRPGAITIEQLRRIVPEAREATRLPKDGEAVGGVRSPGLLHPHYQPHAAVRLVDAPPKESGNVRSAVAFCGLQATTWTEGLPFSTVFATVDEYAAGFYEFLREADRRSIETILVQRVPDAGIGTALLDRQRRAAGE